MAQAPLLSRRVPLAALLVLCLAVLWADAARADDFIGSVKTVQGAAVVVHQGQKLTPALGDHVYQGDVLRTGDGSLGVLFRDDTSIALGPRSEIVLDEFVFDPAGQDVRFLSQMTKGTAMFVTGQIGKIHPEAFRVETPKATIGIRGTRFLVTVP